MKNYLTPLLGTLLLLCIAASQLDAQSWAKAQKIAPNYFTIRQQFLDYWQGQTIEKGTGYSVFRRWENRMKSRILPDGSFPPANFQQAEWQHYQSMHPQNADFGPVANWSSLGPNSAFSGYNGVGRVNSIAVDPGNSNVLWVGAPAGGLWKSVNNGASWITQTDNLPVLGVTAIVINPLNTNIMYIGTGDGFSNDTRSVGVLKSSDGGQTWNSTGLSWSQSNYFYIRFMVINPDNPNVVIAATSDGLYRTTDAGTVWTRVVSDNFYDVKLKPGDPNTVYAASEDIVYRSTNGGASFSVSYTITNSDRLALAVTPANPQMVAVVSSSSVTANFGSFRGLFVSNNSGVSFSVKSTTPNILGLTSDGSSVKGQGWYDLCIAISPTNANTIYVGGINIWKSIDGGASWTLNTYWFNSGLSVPIVHADKHVFTWNGSALLVGCDGGIYKTTNGGASYIDLSNGLTISQMYRLGVSQSDEKLICGLQDNGTKLRSNSGAWTDHIGGDGMECFIHPTNSQIMYGELQNGKVQRSLDGGNSWTSIYSSISLQPTGAWETPFVMDPNNPSTIYAGYDFLYKSVNQGNDWINISPSRIFTPNLEQIAVAPTNSNIIYVSDGNSVFKTSNGGGDWIEVKGNLPSLYITYLAVDPTNADVVYVTFGGYSSNKKVFVSTAGGNTWTNISGTLPNLPANCIAIQPVVNGALFIGMDIGVYRRAYDETDWQLFNNGLPNAPVEELEIKNSTRKIYGATYGRGSWVSDIPPATLCDAPAGLQIIQVESRHALLGWTGVSEASSYDLFYRKAGDPIWNVQSGITGVSASINYLTPCTNYEFRVQTHCPAGPSTFSQTKSFSTPGCSPYCYSYGLDAAQKPIPDEWIQRVDLENIQKNSGNNWGYADFTSESTSLAQGNTYTLILTPGFSGGARTEQWVVWIDYNRDQDFADPGEKVFETISGSTGVVNFTFTVPSSVSIGATRMRISMKRDTPPDYCDKDFLQGEVEDYSIQLLTSILCKAPTYLHTENIKERAAALHWVPTPGASSYVEWRIPGGDWAAKANITSDSFLLTYTEPCTQYEWRARSQCGPNLSDNAPIQTFVTKGCNPYCRAYAYDSGSNVLPDEWIQKVQVGTINNDSGNNWGYADYGNKSTTMVYGQSYTITLTPGFSGAGFNENWAVWIDFDKNYVFDDFGELVYFSPSSSDAAVSGTITIPSWVTTGATTMRVMMSYYSNQGSCSQYEYGEVEDYTILLQGPTPALSLSGSHADFPASGGNLYFTLTTNCNWVTGAIPAWISINPVSGPSGNYNVVVTAPANFSTATLSDFVIFSGCDGQVTDTLFVTQSGAAPFFSLTPTQLSFDASGGSQTISLQTNCHWSMSNLPAWLSVNPSSGTAGNYQLVISALENKLPQALSTPILWTGCGGLLQAMLEIVQAAAQPVVTLDPPNLNFNAEGGTQTVHLTTNCDWTVSALPAWLSIQPAGASAGAFDLAVTVFEHTVPVAQNAVLLFSGCNGLITAELSVNQAAATPFVSIDTSLNFPATGGMQTIALNSNCDWNIGPLPPWVSVLPGSGTAGNYTLQVNAAANTGFDELYAALQFTACNGQAVDSLVIRQFGQQPAIVLQPGWLQFDAAGGTRSITLSTNCPWSLHQLPSWLVVEPASGGPGNFDLQILASVNTQLDALQGQIIAEGCNYQKVDTLFVSVLGADPFISVLPTFLHFNAAGSSQTIELQSNCSWSLGAVPPWLSVVPVSGNAGTQTLSWTAVENSTVDPMSASIDLIACDGQITQPILVEQDGATPYLQVSADSLFFPASGATQTIAINTNCQWTAGIIAPWLTLIPSQGGPGVTSVSLTAAENTSIESLESLVHFEGCSGWTEVDLATIQAGGLPVLALMPDHLEFDEGGGTQVVTVTTNCEWQLIDLPGWLTIDPISGGPGTQSLTCTTDPNLSTDTLQVLLSVVGCNGQNIQLLQVTQQGQPYFLSAGDTAFTISAEQNCFTFELFSNTNWLIQSTPSWINSIQPGLGSGSATVEVCYEANLSLIERSGTLILSGDSVPSVVLVVHQAPAAQYLTVPASIQVPAGEGLVQIEVLSNGDWQVEENSDWLEMPTPSSGFGDAMVSVKHLENPDMASRSALVTFLYNGNQNQVLIEQSGTVGLSEAETAGIWVKCFPNPAKDAAYFILHAPGDEDWMLELIAEDGRKVAWKSGISIDNGDTSLRLDTSGLPAGHYYFRCRLGGALLSGQLILMK